MSRIDQISSKLFEKFLLNCGCIFIRQKGDHKIYQKTGILRPLVVPQKRALPVFIILNNLRVLGISKNEFLNKIDNL